MTVDHAAINNALPQFLKLLRERNAKDGFPWYEPKELETKFHMTTKEDKGQLTKKASADLGMEIDHRADGMGEDLQFVIDLLRQTGGDWNGTLLELYREKTGKPKAAGPLITAARVRLGFVKRKYTKKDHAPQVPAVPSELSEALQMIQTAENAQKKIRAIEDQIATLEIELKKAKEDAAVYSGVLGSLRAVTSAVQGVKQKIAQNAVGIK